MTNSTQQIWVSRVIAALASIMVAACFLWNVEAPTRLGVAILTEQYMALQLGLALTICFLRFSWRGPVKAHVGVVDGAIALLCFGVLMYAAWDFVWLLREQAYRPWQITLVGAVVTLAVMEGIRRRAGWTLFSIVALFMVYALFADRVPGDLIGVALTPERLVGYVGFDPSAVFSTPLRVGTIIVLLFVFFGQLLFAAGGGAFFTDLAMAATGRARGGSAKISRRGVRSVRVDLGLCRVERGDDGRHHDLLLMQRGGYSKRDAGAIEAVASTGGQLTPPIMGAAAFLMAEFLEISYMSVAAAALLPAILYYISIFVQVDLMAGRDKIAAPEEELSTVGEVMRAGWHFMLPFAVLLGALFWWRMDPEDSALLASVAIVIVAFTREYRGTRLTLRRLGQVFVDTGTSMVDLILVVAAAGFVIGILNITGLGFALTLVLVEAIGSNLILLLLISALICILLGMGMPTSGVYVLLATLVAPSLVRAGVEPIAAHLFILYFGMMSMITPPVALAAIAAASITKTNAIATGFAAMRIGWAAYIIPFLFVATPALLMDGTWAAILSAAALAILGIGAICVGMVGFLNGPLNLGSRALFVIGGIAALPLGQYPDAAPHLGWIAAAGLAVLTGALVRLGKREDTSKTVA